PAEQDRGRLRLTPLDLADHRPGHTRSLGQRVHGQILCDPGGLHGRRERGRQFIHHACHYSGICGYYRGMAKVRDASPLDGEACAAIYAPYVTGTAITFEIQPPTAAEMAQRIADAQATHAWMVREDGGRVSREGEAGPMKARADARWLRG